MECLRQKQVTFDVDPVEAAAVEERALRRQERKIMEYDGNDQRSLGEIFTRMFWRLKMDSMVDKRKMYQWLIDPTNLHTFQLWYNQHFCFQHTLNGLFQALNINAVGLGPQLQELANRPFEGNTNAETQLWLLVTIMRGHNSFGAEIVTPTSTPTNTPTRPGVGGRGGPPGGANGGATVVA